MATIDGTKMIAFSPLPQSVSHGDQQSAYTAAVSPHPADTSAGATAANPTASSSGANSPTLSNGRRPGRKPNSAGASFRFLNEKTKQEPETEFDRAAVQVCPHCKRPFTPRATGRPPTFCSPGCRMGAWRARQRGGGE